MARPLEMRDADDVIEWMGDLEVARYEYWEPLNRDAVEKHLSDLVSREPATPNAWSEYALVLKTTGKVIGSLSVKPGDGPEMDAEIGFKLNRRYQRQGFATEATRAMLEYSFRAGVSRVFAVVDTRNASSIALLERIGMRRERHIRRSCFVKGEWCDEYVYAKT